MRFATYIAIRCNQELYLALDSFITKSKSMVILCVASNPKAVATTKAIFGICVDPCNPYRIATYAEVANYFS